MKKSTEEQQRKELRALAEMKDSEIDLSDIPEVTDWSAAVVGRFYRPRKEPVTLRLDADVLAWFKRKGRGYQTRINAVLREEMERSRKQKSTDTREKSSPGKYKARAAGAGAD